MKTTIKLTALAAIVASFNATGQVPGMSDRSTANTESNSLSLTAPQPAPFQPGHQGNAPANAQATPADAGLPQSRPAQTATSTPAAVPPIVAPAPTAASVRSSIAAPTPSISVSQAVTNIDSQLLELARLQQDTERSRAELELLNAREQIQEVARRTQGNQTGLTEVPLLVGIMTNRGNLVAEFLANGAVLQVAEGEMVSPEWQLEKIRQTSVEIKRRGRNERHVLMFGGSARAP